MNLPFLHSRAWCVCAALLAAGLSLVVPASARAAEEQLEVSPTEVELNEVYSRQQLLVAVPGPYGPEDVTRQSQYQSSDRRLVRVETGGYLIPLAPGRARVEVSYQNRTAIVAVTVKAFDRDRPIHFGNEIVPLLTRYGCNAGGCHGRASGQNGFKLSLFGFDPVFDFNALVMEGRGRRIFPGAPESSLILAKAAGGLPHGGGARFTPDSEPYQMLVRWIRQGMPKGAADAPVIARLVVEPAERVLKHRKLQQLRVIAQYSDATRRDVTRQARFQSNEDAIATVSPEGLVETGEQTGEAAVMVSYLGQVAVFQALLPHGPPLASLEGFAPRGYIDELAAAKWRKLGLHPSPPADDSTFLRRVTVDLCGRLPRPDEAVAFLKDPAPDKRARLIDRLLDSPDYSAYWAMRFGSILHNSERNGAYGLAIAFHHWLRDQFALNRPYDEIVRALVATSGEPSEAPAVNRYWQLREDMVNKVTADTAQVFLGIRLQCAQCHHHPYEKWSQDDYFGLAGFFMRLATKGGQPFTLYAADRVVQTERDPRTGKVPEPMLLDGRPIVVPAGRDPRQALVDWMARPDNPFFARALVNRLWGHLFGRGLVEPVDDFRLTNPPSNPALLDALARDFVDHGYDLKHMFRVMAGSALYQLASEPTASNQADRQNFARYPAKRLIAEVFLDAVDQVCGSRTSFPKLPSKFRAVDLPHEGFKSDFLDTFDRPARVTGCECERGAGANLSQVLLLANSAEVEDKIASSGRIGAALKGGKPPRAIIEELYLAAFTRFPTDAELARCLAHVESRSDPRRALEDLLWVLLNTKEFALNR